MDAFCNHTTQKIKYRMDWANAYSGQEFKAGVCSRFFAQGQIIHRWNTAKVTIPNTTIPKEDEKKVGGAPGILKLIIAVGRRVSRRASKS